MDIKKDIDHLTGRLSDRVDDLRGRTTSMVEGVKSSDSGASANELRRIRDRMERLEDRLADRMSALSDEQSHRLDAAMDSMTTGRRTTWPRRMFWMLMGVGAGMVAQFLADPDRGRSRRAQLSDQLAARSRDVADQARKKTEVATDRAKGMAYETAKAAKPQDVPSDPKKLEQRIRSHVFGYRDDVDDVVIRVDSPGQVALKGTVPNHGSAEDLVNAVRDVEGVLDVRNELAIRTG